MVEFKNSVLDDGSDDSPPLVQAEHAPIAELHTLEPMRIEVVTIDAELDPLCHASVVSSNSAEADSSSNNEAPETQVDDSTQAFSAGIAGGVVGTLLGGPILGLVAGGAAAHYSRQEGAAGDVSRALGEVAITTGTKAKELNEKHNLVGKGKEAAADAWKRAKDINEKHHLAHNGQQAAKTAWENMKEFDRKHGVVKKLTDVGIFCFKQIVKLVEYAVKKLQEVDNDHQGDERAQTSVRISRDYQKVPHQARVH